MNPVMTTMIQESLTYFLFEEIYARPWMVEDSRNDLTSSMVGASVQCHVVPGFVCGCILDIVATRIQSSTHGPGRSQTINTFTVYKMVAATLPHGLDGERNIY